MQTILSRTALAASLLMLVSVTGCGEAPATQTQPQSQPLTQKAFVIDPATVSPVNGFWAGHWKADAEPGEGKSLTCETVQVSDDEWKATFNAVCDKDYSFTMDMPGQRVGDDVVFEVSVDLGELFGGEYHWTGEVKGDEFNGVYTNAKYNGTFHMVKSPDAASNAADYCEVPEDVPANDGDPVEDAPTDNDLPPGEPASAGGL